MSCGAKNRAQKFRKQFHDNFERVNYLTSLVEALRRTHSGAVNPDSKSRGLHENLGVLLMFLFRWVNTERAICATTALCRVRAAIRSPSSALADIFHRRWRGCMCTAKRSVVSLPCVEAAFGGICTVTANGVTVQRRIAQVVRTTNFFFPCLSVRAAAVSSARSVFLSRCAKRLLNAPCEQ